MLQGVEKGDVRALHRTRVASRRLREVLPVLALDSDVTAKLSSRLRKITSRLGEVREADVLLGVIDELGKDRRYPPDALASLAALVREDRERARQRNLSKSRISELHRVAAKLNKLGRRLESEEAAEVNSGVRTAGRAPAGPEPWRWAIEARIARRASALADTVSEAGTLYLVERLHAVRIAAKKLRYALELSADVTRRRSTPELRLLRRVQDTLGRLHDLETLVGRARAAQTSLTPPDITVWRQLDTVIGLLEDDCRRLHARYLVSREQLLALCVHLSGRAYQKVSATRRTSGAN
jgi:CHAD domain-containing protein